MTPLILFYNLNNEKGRTIKLICLKLKIRIRPVAPEDYFKPVGTLAGFRELPVSDAGNNKTSTCENDVFSDEMLVMKDFDNRLLDRFLLEMKRAKIERIALKAVLTPDNITWNSIELHDELIKEHEAMTKEPPTV